MGLGAFILVKFSLPLKTRKGNAPPRGSAPSRSAGKTTGAPLLPPAPTSGPTRSLKLLHSPLHRPLRSRSLPQLRTSAFPSPFRLPRTLDSLRVSLAPVSDRDSRGPKAGGSPLTATTHRPARRRSSVAAVWRSSGRGGSGGHGGGRRGRGLLLRLHARALRPRFPLRRCRPPAPRLRARPRPLPPPPLVDAAFFSHGAAPRRRRPLPPGDPPRSWADLP
jgi:hypothetical protein